MAVHNKGVLVGVWLDPALAEQVKVATNANPFAEGNRSEWIRLAITEKLQRCEHSYEKVGDEYHCKRCGIAITWQEHAEWEMDQALEQDRAYSIDDRKNCL